MKIMNNNKFYILIIILIHIGLFFISTQGFGINLPYSRIKKINYNRYVIYYSPWNSYETSDMFQINLTLFLNGSNVLPPIPRNSFEERYLAMIMNKLIEDQKNILKEKELIVKEKELIIKKKDLNENKKLKEKEIKILSILVVICAIAFYMGVVNIGKGSFNSLNSNMERILGTLKYIGSEFTRFINIVKRFKLPLNSGIQLGENELPAPAPL